MTGPDTEQEAVSASSSARQPWLLRMTALNGAVARWTAVVMLGTFALITGLTLERGWLSPGPLTSPHRFTEGCASCHSNIREGQFGWLHGLVNASSGKDDSSGCLSCHKFDEEDVKPKNRHVFEPHGVSQTRLKRVAEEQTLRDASRQVQARGDGAILTRLNAFAGQIAGAPPETVFCATCHKEHRGNMLDTTAAINEQCQTCHQVQFTQFDQDHPDFSSYPFKRRTRVIFDHARHFGTHFKETKQKQPNATFIPDTCSSCHETGKDKKHMDVASFDDTCSNCHLPQIVGTERATGPKGLALLALPAIDLETLRERKAPIGSWPVETEAELTPLMQLLLAGTPEREALLASVRPLDLQDLSAASEQQIEAVTNLVWEIKGLFNDLSTLPATQILQRIGHNNSKAKLKQVAQLLATMPRDVLVNAQRDWLPRLSAEIGQRKQSDWKTVFAAVGAAGSETVDAGGDAQVDGGAQLDETASTGDGDSAASDGAEKKPDAGEPVDKLKTKPDKGRWYVNVLGEIIQEGDESEAAKEAAKGLNDNAGEVRQASVAAEGEADAQNAEASAADGAAAKVEVKLDEAAEVVVDEETWNELGGWYRKDYAILYKPTGHKDAFLQSWFDFSGQRDSGNESPERTTLANSVFDLLSSKDAQGQCAKCHSIDASKFGGRTVQWTPATPKHKKSRFTKFSHEPHFAVLDDRGCLTCHEMNAPKDLKTSYKGTDPHSFQSNFKPVKKDLCANCHKTEAARQDCQLCHAYHVSPVTTPMTETKLPVKIKAEK